MTSLQNNSVSAKIPTSVMVRVSHAVRSILEFRQAIREARHYATIIAGEGKGTIDRDYFVQARSNSGVSAKKVRESRALIQQVIGIAGELGIDGRSVVAQVWADEAAALPEKRFEMRPVMGGSRFFS